MSSFVKLERYSILLFPRHMRPAESVEIGSLSIIRWNWWCWFGAKRRQVRIKRPFHWSGPRVALYKRHNRRFVTP